MLLHPFHSCEQRLLIKLSTEKKKKQKTMPSRDFPGGPVVKNLPSNAGDTGSIPGQGTKTPTCCS